MTAPIMSSTTPKKVITPVVGTGAAIPVPDLDLNVSEQEESSSTSHVAGHVPASAVGIESETADDEAT